MLNEQNARIANINRCVLNVEPPVLLCEIRNQSADRSSRMAVLNEEPRSVRWKAFNKLLMNGTGSSLLDQAAVSGGNFLTALVLARILQPAAYGTFSLLFLALFALNTCHSSLIVYPLTLRGSTASREEIRTMTGAALIHTLLLSIPLAGILSMIAALLHQTKLFPYLVLAMGSWQIQETLRRALLSNLRFNEVILPDFVCYVGQGLLLLLLRPTRLEVVFVVVALTSAVAATWQLVLLRVTGMCSLSVQHANFSWRMGRFILAGNVLNMLTLQIPSWTLLMTAGTLAVARYQSLLNLVGIANPVIFSVNSLLIPVIAREARHGFRKARKIAAHYGLRYGLILLPVFLVMFIDPQFVMRLVYGKVSPYLELAPLLRVFVFAFVLQYLATVIGAYEGGMSRPKTYMWVQIISTGVLLSLGTTSIVHFGLRGAVGAMVLASGVRLLAFACWARNSDLESFTTLLETH